MGAQDSARILHMLVIIGYIICLGCIFGMYVLHGGNISVILKALPFELVTILGGAMGAFVARRKVLSAVTGQSKAVA